MAEPSLPSWWVVLFLALALGAGAAAVLLAGGTLVTGATAPALT